MSHNGKQITSRKDIPAEKMIVIRQLHIPDNKQAWGAMGVFMLMLATSFYLQLGFSSVLIRTVGAIVMIFTICRSGLLMHEASHLAFFKNKSLNRLAGLLCGCVVPTTPSAYRFHHIRHHLYELTESDPDDYRNVSKRLMMPLYITYIFILFFGTASHLATTFIVGVTEARGAERRRIITEYTVLGAIFAAMIYFITPHEFIRVWIFPFAFAQVLMNFRNIADHGFLSGEDVFTNTRTITSNKFFSFLMLNQNYHLEHHLFPSMPFYNLPKANALLRDEYRTAHSSVETSHAEFAKWFIPNLMKLRTSS